MAARNNRRDRDPQSARDPLRAQAEDKLLGGADNRDASALSADEARALIHELQVHQAELEIQNEELRLAQVELAESRDRFSDLYEFAPVGYLTLDAEGRIAEANLAAAALLGANRSDLVGGRLEPSVAGGSGDTYYLHRLDVMASDEKRTCELRMHRRDGTPLVVRLESIVSGNEPDRGCRIALIDITGLREAEEGLEDANRSLRQERDFTERLIETAPSLVLLLDREGRVLRFNPAFERLSGWSLSEAIGRDWFSDFFSGPDRKRFRKVFKEALAGKRLRGLMGSLRTKDGRLRKVEWFDAPLTDETGGMIGLLWNGNDVTERFELEQRINRVAEEEKERIARDLHDSLGSLLTGIGYRAAGLSRKLREGLPADPEEAENILEQIRDTIVRVRSLSQGLQPVKDEPGALETALEELVEWVEMSSDLRCEFVFSAGETAAPVSISDAVVANQLYQIAREAATNAMRHSGATRLTVRLEQDAERVLLCVSDDGVGFDPAAIDPQKKGIGLQTMEYRARMIGGELFMRPRNRGGTAVECKIGVP